eukprot:CAMPEP_0174255324 /NCGR_PEP_ID=MMETSP0439-20130205/4664_1 /TAXON_ID=0 /ORGANISM="Stereomyxa ramosa, Strain Chinc5" /LENGTH=515 /DNA_ID=CAMNT_0015337457 /DNA_START=6 /DNA_END=1553 /DNA_ORIENTATION=-
MTTNTLVDVYEGTQDAQSTALIVPPCEETGGAKIELSYARLREEIRNATQVLLSFGVTPGAPVSIVVINSLEYVVTYFASVTARAVGAPLNPKYGMDEFVYYFKSTEAKFVIVERNSGQEARKAAAELQLPIIEVWKDVASGRVHLSGSRAAQPVQYSAPKPTDVALFLHTSGTTSRPKGVPLRHQNLVASVKNIVDTYSLTPDDRVMLVMPLFHVHGLIGCLFSTLYSGGTVVLPPRFSASTFWGDVLENDCTWYSAVPTIHQILLKTSDRDYKGSGRLRFIRSCSASLAPAVLRKLEAKFQVPVIEAYAMTEASHQMTANFLPPGVHKPGSVGKGRGVEVAILNDQWKEVGTGQRGEICVRGPTVTSGYHNRAEANAECFNDEGWFRTGDEGYKDSDGFVFICGRLKELVNRGGEKISPNEIDAVLLAHPDVVEAVCFGVPDEKYGEEIQAAVILKKGSSATEQSIKDFVLSKVTDFKCPKKVYIVDDFPRTATGKIQRRIVSAHFYKPKAKL